MSVMALASAPFTSSTSATRSSSCWDILVSFPKPSRTMAIKESSFLETARSSTFKNRSIRTEGIIPARVAPASRRRSLPDRHMNPELENGEEDDRDEEGAVTGGRDHGGDEGEDGEDEDQSRHLQVSFSSRLPNGSPGPRDARGRPAPGRRGPDGAPGRAPGSPPPAWRLPSYFGCSRSPRCPRRRPCTGRRSRSRPSRPGTSTGRCPRR